MHKQRRIKARQVIVPLALGVTAVSSAVALSSSIGCGDPKPPADAGNIGDTLPDTPII